MNNLYIFKCNREQTDLQQLADAFQQALATFKQEANANIPVGQIRINPTTSLLQTLRGKMNNTRSHFQPNHPPTCWGAELVVDDGIPDGEFYLIADETLLRNKR